MGNKDHVYSQKQLQSMIVQMSVASSDFYASAVQIGNHPFIEFCGLMNEYILCCQDALDEGMDFTQCNTHTGCQLPMKSFRVDYINEKLECIFTGRSVMSKGGKGARKR